MTNTILADAATVNMGLAQLDNWDEWNMATWCVQDTLERMV